jgi:lipoprotein-anchoring transpeptidase ErfK/SrfK
MSSWKRAFEKYFILVTSIVATLGLPPVAPASHAASHTKGRAVTPFTSALKTGDYEWHPEISPAGPVVILVRLPDQVLYVYRNGVRIGRSTVSTGKAGKRTPTGVFTVLQKKVRHESSIYKGAKMPHMQRLTWTGIALHAGQLPGYPASAGCVRMPVDFAAKLWTDLKPEERSQKLQESQPLFRQHALASRTMRENEDERLNFGLGI